MEKFFGTILGIFSVLLWILAGVMHLYTVFAVYQMSGVFMGFVSLCFPVISEIVVGIMAVNLAGFTTPYVLGLIILIAGWIFFFVLSVILTTIESKANRYEA